MHPLGVTQGDKSEEGKEKTSEQITDKKFPELKKIMWEFIH